MSRPQKIHQKSIINNKSIVTPLQKTNKQKVDGQKETNWRYQKKIQKLIFFPKKKKMKIQKVLPITQQNKASTKSIFQQITA